MMINFIKQVAGLLPIMHFVVRGESMLPTLGVGQHVLALRGGIYLSKFSVGDIVILRHPREPRREIIKRIASISESGEYFVEGDNRGESQDSRSFGYVSKEFIIGKVLG